MRNEWYYAVEGERFGPVTFTELRRLAQTGRISEYDLVWHPEFGPEWRNAGQVREMFEVPYREAAAPPISGMGEVTLGRPHALRAASQAFARMTALLFRPFDPVRWFSIGFCAWLAYLGTQSTVNLQQLGETSAGGFKQQVDRMIDVLQLLPEQPVKLAWTGFAILLGLLFALWMCWVRSRGDFMFLHRWYKPDTPVHAFWMASRSSGWALFGWRVLFFLVAAALFVLHAAIAYTHVLKPYLDAGRIWQPALLPPVTGCVTSLALLLIAVRLVAYLTQAFVVPLMYWSGCGVASAWRMVLALVNRHPFALTGYLLCGMACWSAAMFAVLVFGLVTCCIGFIPLVLPYLNAVLLLPVTFFFRGYAVCFLSQWRPDLVPAAEGDM